jgi:tight adherence protein C
MLGLLEVTGMYVLAGMALGFFGPDMWVSGLIKERQSAVLASMPFIVDLLALSTEAGLDFVGAIGKVVEKAKSSPLVDELAQMLREMKLGVSRADSLREMSLRLGMTEINSFVAILISADQMGASIGKVLKQQSDQIRSERLLRAEKEGAAAATKIMLPMAFLLLPAIGIVVAMPFVLDYLSSGN